MGLISTNWFLFFYDIVFRNPLKMLVVKWSVPLESFACAAILILCNVKNEDLLRHVSSFVLLKF